MNTFAGNFSATSTLDLGGFTLTARGGGVIISQSGDNTTTLVQNGSITSGLAGTGGDLFLYPSPTAARRGGSFSTLTSSITALVPCG